VTRIQRDNAAVIERHRYLEVLHEFTMRQASMKSVDDICWNIAKTAIGELGFVDCVVYLMNEAHSELVQRAAHGNKNLGEREILDPITIPVGEGIVGSVGETGVLERVEDTRYDERYILDDSFRCSELAVPILREGKVIGVLDSEHPEPHFFSDEDVKLFTTIAALASTRIDTALALERLEKQAEELIDARREAEAASKAKSRFLASISHDMRTPLTAILGYSKLAEEGASSQKQMAAWQRAIVANAEYMADMVGNVLDLTVLESGQVTLSSDVIVLADWVANLGSLLNPRILQKGLSFRSSMARDVPRQILCDKAKLTELTMNLLTNAVKYTVSGRVEFFMGLSRLDDRAALNLTVNDTGIGMSPDDLKVIFEPFTRVHDHEDFINVEGTGLGLSIVELYVDALGGSITVNSVPGEGTCFDVMIPIRPAKEGEGAATESELTQEPKGVAIKPTAVLKDLRILLCEDSETVATLVTLILERDGALVIHAENGESGMKHFSDSKQRFDVVITDIQMPIMDGYALAGALRAEGWSKPIIALTAFATDQDADNCLSAGCSHYRTKPIDVGTFASQVASSLGDTLA
jgi:signal transduction histidine kinase/ActR/RegA family two-component response regulator